MFYTITRKRFQRMHLGLLLDGSVVAKVYILTQAIVYHSGLLEVIV